MVAAVIGMLYSYRLGRRSESKLRGWLAGAVLTVVMAGVFNLATWGGAHLYGDRSPAVADISAAFGLTPGKEYPLQVGGRTGGAKVTATQAGDHFGYTATTGSSVALVEPSSSVTANLAVGDGVTALAQLRRDVVGHRSGDQHLLRRRDQLGE